MDCQSKNDNAFTSKLHHLSNSSLFYMGSLTSWLFCFFNYKNSGMSQDETESTLMVIYLECFVSVLSLPPWFQSHPPLFLRWGKVCMRGSWRPRNLSLHESQTQIIRVDLISTVLSACLQSNTESLLTGLWIHGFIPCMPEPTHCFQPVARLI